MTRATAAIPKIPIVLLTRTRLPIIPEYASLRAPPTTGTAELMTSLIPFEATVSAALASAPLIPKKETKSVETKVSTAVTDFFISEVIPLSLKDGMIEPVTSRAMTAPTTGTMQPFEMPDMICAEVKDIDRKLAASVGLPVTVTTAARTGIRASISFSPTAIEAAAELIAVERGEMTEIMQSRVPTILTAAFIFASSGEKQSKIAIKIITATRRTAERVGASILPVISFFARAKIFCGVTLSMESKSALSAPISFKSSCVSELRESYISLTSSA